MARSRNIPTSLLCGTIALAILAFLPPALAGQGSYVDVNGTRLYFESKGAGPALVLIHGWALNADWWEDQVPAFRTRYRVIRYDRRGFGRSPGVPDPTADPADLDALLTHLGIEQAYLLGHSQGGVVALGFALDYPGRVLGLILFGSGPPMGLGLPPGADSMPFGQLRLAARGGGADSVWKLLASHPIQGHDRLSDEALARVERMKRTYTAADLRSDQPPSGQTPPATVAQLSTIRAPTLVVTGDAEIPYLRVVAEVLAYAIPEAQRVVIPGGGHMLSMSQPAAFNRTVLAFLGSLPR